MPGSWDEMTTDEKLAALRDAVNSYHEAAANTDKTLLEKINQALEQIEILTRRLDKTDEDQKGEGN